MRVLHVVDEDLARGAQRGAQMLRDALDRSDDGGDVHQLATLFDSTPAVLAPDVELDVPDGRTRRLGLAPAAVAALRRDEIAREADVLVAHGGETLKYLCGARLPGAIVYHKIGVLGAGFDRWASARLHRWAVSRADAVVAISKEAALEAHDKLGVPYQRMTTIPNGRDPLVFRPIAKPIGKLAQITFVGHLSPTKRPNLFLDVVERLRARGFYFDATMAGDGPDFESLVGRARLLGVTMPGSQSDIPSLLARTDVFIFTSIREGEGMPGVLIEAAMSGAVPVATDVPGAAQVVANRTTGYLVDPDDIESMIERASVLLTKPVRRRDMARVGRQRAVASFSTAQVAEQWADACRRVVATRGGKPCASSI